MNFTNKLAVTVSERVNTVMLTEIIKGKLITLIF